MNEENHQIANPQAAAPHKTMKKQSSSRSLGGGYGSMHSSSSSFGEPAPQQQSIGLSPITPSKIFSPRNEIQQLTKMLSGRDLGSTEEESLFPPVKEKKNHTRSLSSDIGMRGAMTDQKHAKSERSMICSKTEPIDIEHYERQALSERNLRSNRSRAATYEARPSRENVGNGSRKNRSFDDTKARRKLSKSRTEGYIVNGGTGGSSRFFEPMEHSIREDQPEAHPPETKNITSVNFVKKDRHRKSMSLDDNVQQQQQQQQLQGQQHSKLPQQKSRKTRSNRQRTQSDIRGLLPSKNFQKYTVLQDEENQLMSSVELKEQFDLEPTEYQSLLSRPSKSAHLKQMDVERFVSGVRGVTQEKKCHDVVFALLFYAHFALIAWVSIQYGAYAIFFNNSNSFWSFNVASQDESQSGTTTVMTLDYQNTIKLAVLCGLFASSLSGIALWFMTLFPGKLIQVALILSVSMSFIWGTFGIGFFSQSFVPATGIIALLITVGYTFVVWDRIPFASANVFTAFSLAYTKPGVVYPLLIMELLMLFWTIWWAFAFLGVYDWTETADKREWLPYIAMVLVISFYWTYKVIVHVIQVTVAGIIKEAWFDATQANSCCVAPVVRTSFFNACVYSFGSICFGSLIVGPIQVLHQILLSFIPQRSEQNALLCLQECLLVITNSLLHLSSSVVHYVNPWSFTYIGLYGYNFLDAGEKATTLFDLRGWNKISHDALLTNVIFIFNVMIGGCTGVLAFLIEYFTDFSITSLSNHSLVAFVIGFYIGFVLSAVFLSVVHSSVEAIIVLYASYPIKLEFNYPALSKNLRLSWKEVWPGFMNIDIFKKSNPKPPSNSRSNRRMN